MGDGDDNLDSIPDAHTGHRTACKMPLPALPADAEVYAAIRQLVTDAHCDRKNRTHHCCGAVTITAKHITMQCRLCGDARELLDYERSLTHVD